MSRRFAISDIHGCAKSFIGLLIQIGLTREDELYLLGDYIDRGRDSKGVIDHILWLKKDGYNVRCLRGNHEQLLLLGLNGDGYLMNVWMNNGGTETLNSYNLMDPEKIPEDHQDFLRSTEFYIELPDYFLVHAGFNFEAENFREDTNAMMWIRRFQPDAVKLGHRPIIHGHTPIPFQKILSGAERMAETNEMDIDNGCVYLGRKGCGGLVAFDLDTREVHRIANCD